MHKTSSATVYLWYHQFNDLPIQVQWVIYLFQFANIIPIALAAATHKYSIMGLLKVYEVRYCLMR